MSPEDLARVDIANAKLVIILCNTYVVDFDGEDRANTLRALAVKHVAPHANLRLMLMRAENRAQAIRVGIRASCCISINELKSSVLSISCRCQGWSTLIANMLLSIDATDDSSDPESDRQEYLASAANGVFGLSLAPQYEGLQFKELVEQAFAHNLTPIAMQVDGRIVLNPWDQMVKAYDIVFVMASCADAVRCMSTFDRDWRTAFSMAQATSGDVHGLDRHHVEGRDPLRQCGTSIEVKLPAGRSERIFRVLPHLRIASSIKKGQAKKVQHTNLSEESKHGELNDEEARAAERKALLIAERGNHVLLVLRSPLWQSARSFVRGLREPYLPYLHPIVILSTVRPSRHEYDEITRSHDVGIAFGSLEWKKNIERCAASDAWAIVLLAIRPGHGDDFRMIDGHGVMTVVGLEKEHVHSRTVLELLNENSVALLERSSEGVALDDTVSFDVPLNLHPRFASGELFSGSCFGALLATSYYTPGIVELMEALAHGTQYSQHTFPWQISVPAENVGESFEMLAKKLWSGWPVTGPNAPCTIPIGLYRASASEDDGTYVVNHPEGSMVLREFDLVFVLGTEEFGKECNRVGILVDSMVCLAQNEQSFNDDGKEHVDC